MAQPSASTLSHFQHLYYSLTAMAYLPDPEAQMLHLHSHRHHLSLPIHVCQPVYPDLLYQFDRHHNRHHQNCLHRYHRLPFIDIFTYSAQSHYRCCLLQVFVSFKSPCRNPYPFYYFI